MTASWPACRRSWAASGRQPSARRTACSPSRPPSPPPRRRPLWRLVVLWISRNGLERISVVDPDPAFQVNPDPDPPGLIDNH